MKLYDLYDIHNGFGGAVCENCLPDEMDRLGGYGGRYAVRDVWSDTVTRCGVCSRSRRGVIGATYSEMMTATYEGGN